MHSDDAIVQRRARFGQNYGESDEGKRLPEFRRFEPDQKTEEPRADDCEKAADGALLLVVAQSRKFCCEIKRGAENRKRDEARSYVRVRRALQVKVEEKSAEQRGRT
jgi:hypothetical protein